MKKSTLFITTVLASLFFFAACKNNQATAPALATDTTGLAQFQEWKAMQAEQEALAAVAAQQKTVRRNYNSGSNSGSMTSSTTNEAKVTKKKGMSKAARYAMIGAAGGAVTGAVINKRDRVKGGIIGGVLLGAGGYIFGRSQDKKDGRY